MANEIEHVLPTGLVFHCDKCKLVVPVEAPNIPNAACEWVAQHKLSYYEPKTTIAGQHAMAVGTWELIHHQALTAGSTEGIEYKQKFKLKRKEHYAESAVFKAMTPEQIQADITHAAHGRRDGWLYKEGN